MTKLIRPHEVPARPRDYLPTAMSRGPRRLAAPAAAHPAAKAAASLGAALRWLLQIPPRHPPRRLGFEPTRPVAFDHLPAERVPRARDTAVAPSQPALTAAATARRSAASEITWLAEVEVREIEMGEDERRRLFEQPAAWMAAPHPAATRAAARRSA